MSQAPLFWDDDRELPPFVGHSETSRLAALSFYPRQGTARRKVLDFIAESGGATDEEIQDALRMSGNTERPRRVELTDYRDLPKLIKDSGMKRRTRSGEWAVVWVLKDELTSPATQGAGAPRGSAPVGVSAPVSTNEESARYGAERLQ